MTVWPPPETLAVLVTLAGALLATVTVPVIAVTGPVQEHVARTGERTQRRTTVPLIAVAVDPLEVCR